MAELDKKKTAKGDPVNHPAHYEREGAMECIDEMLLIFGKEAVMNFCLCNAWKYRYRASAKNGDEDYSKSDWYLRKYRELKEGVNKVETPPKLIYQPCQDDGIYYPYYPNTSKGPSDSTSDSTGTYNPNNFYYDYATKSHN